MKHLSMVSLIVCLAFTPAGKQSTLSVGHSSSIVEHPSILPHGNQTAVKWIEITGLTEADLQQQYYWFFYPGDYYWDHKTLADEINEMWMLYGAPVNTVATGTLIDRGYNSQAYPHTNYPMVYLYVQY